jgi:hypothetical protein
MMIFLEWFEDDVGEPSILAEPEHPMTHRHLRG